MDRKINFGQWEQRQITSEIDEVPIQYVEQSVESEEGPGSFESLSIDERQAENDEP